MSCLSLIITSITVINHGISNKGSLNIFKMLDRVLSLAVISVWWTWNGSLAPRGRRELALRL